MRENPQQSQAYQEHYKIYCELKGRARCSTVSIVVVVVVVVVVVDNP